MIIQVKEEWPPNIKEIEKVFDLKGIKPVFTYGQICYNPYKLPIPDHLRVHEQTHAKQQINPEKWWEEYLTNPKFRLEQELEAYRAQYEYAKTMIKDRNVLARFLHAIVSDMSGKMYGFMVKYSEAMKLLQK